MRLRVKAEAFERKAELGGGFRGHAVVYFDDSKTKGKFSTAIHDTKKAAWLELVGMIYQIGTPSQAAHWKSDPFRKDYWI